VIAASTATISDTTSWHHVAATKSGTAVHLYIDGKDVTGTVTNKTLVNNTQPLLLGQNAGSGWLNGVLDEVALYKTALTANAIANHFMLGGASCSTNGPYAETVSQAASLIGYWRLDDAPGPTACDIQGRNPGAYQGGVTAVQAGLTSDTSKAATLDGTTGSISVPPLGSLNTGDTFSIEAWVRRGAVGGAAKQVIASKQGAAWTLLFNTSNQLVLLSGTSQVAASTTPISDTTTWHHVAATKAGSTVKLYVDGKDVTGTVTAATLANSTSPLAIGQSGSASFFKGSIDDVALYSTALPSSVISGHYALGAAPANNGRPAITGSIASGDLSAVDGQWVGATSFKYQWRSCDSSGGSCSDIPGATAATYKAGPSQAGHRLRILVTADNGAGSTTATSDASEVVPATVGAVGPPPAVPPGEPLVFVKDDALMFSDDLADGDPGVKIADAPFTWMTRAALSPDGQTAAYVGGPGMSIIYTVNTDGTNRREVFNATPPDETSGFYVEDVAFSPDGQSLVVAGDEWPSGSARYEYIGLVSLVSKERTIIKKYPVGADQPGGGTSVDQVRFTADGRYILAGTRKYDNTDWVIQVLTPDGTPVRSLSFAGIEGVFNPVPSPDPDFIAFSGGSVSDTTYPPAPHAGYTARIDGSSLQRITPEGDGISAFTPDGHSIVGSGHPFDLARPSTVRDLFIMSAAGSGQYPLISGTGDTNFAAPMFRQPSNLTFDDVLARTFRPVLRFDSSEQWRPLNVESFFGEVNPSGYFNHQVCTPDPAAPTGLGCVEVNSTAALRGFRNPASYLDVGTDNNGDYTSPYAFCHQDELVDCDTGPLSAIYYHVRPSTGSYSYLDYGLFYRFNDVFGGSGTPLGTEFQHEADWEGVTVAVDPQHPETFAYAAFAQHAHVYHYMRNTIECDEGGFLSCYTGAPPTPKGHRVRAYVARRSHATYPQTCQELVGVTCSQTMNSIPEGGHDGSKGWGNNDDPAALLPLPRAGEWSSPPAGNWVDWPGAWGTEQKVESPGNQGRYNAPYASVCGESQCKRSVQIRGSQPPRRDAPASCSSWFGGDVVALACSHSGLAKSLASERLNRRGSLRFVGLPRAARRGSAPGLAQVVGRPLRNGEGISLRGAAGTKTILMVRGVCGKRLYQGTARDIDGPVRGSKVSFSCGSRPGFRWRGPRPAVVHTRLLPTPRPTRASPPRFPQLLSMRRSNGRLTLRVTTGPRGAAVSLYQRLGDRPLFTKKTVGPNNADVSLPLLRRARYVVIKRLDRPYAHTSVRLLRAH
jgi:WD40 repeat protein